MRHESYSKVITKHYFLEYIIETNHSGVYALINEKHKRVYIQGAKRILSSAMDLLGSIGDNSCPTKELIDDRSNLSLKILEQNINPKHIKILKYKWIDKYKTEGYTIYNTEKLPVYNKTIIINEDGLFELLVITGGKRVRSVKTFSDRQSLDKYVESTNVYDMLL